MRESELLRRIEARSADLAGRGPIVIGPGDDCAVLALPGSTLATVDQLVAGRHFDPDSTSVEQIARKAMARAVSDIAAMGGAPSVALAAGCLPEGYPHADRLCQCLARSARELGCPLVGGDIAMGPGPLVLTITVLGEAHPERGPVTRDAARPGDALYVTGAIGGSLESGRHLSFSPRLAEGQWLCHALGPRLHAMIDLSDGLGRDAGRIAQSSLVRIVIEAPAIPLHADAGGWRDAIDDGEDYELLFTADPGAVLLARCPATGTLITRIGRVEEGSGCIVRSPESGGLEVGELGWDHGP